MFKQSQMQQHRLESNMYRKYYTAAEHQRLPNNDLYSDTMKI